MKMKVNKSISIVLLSILISCFLVSCSVRNHYDSSPDSSIIHNDSYEYLTEDAFDSSSAPEGYSTDSFSTETYEVIPEPDSAFYFNYYFNISRNDILDWLFQHETDDYYLKTPYADAEYGFDAESCMRPNGRFSGDLPQMSCTGFVLDVLMQSSSERAEEVHSLAADMVYLCESNGWCNDIPYFQNEMNAYYWGAFISQYENGKIYSLKFETIKDLLESHLAKKGDILFFMPEDAVYSIDEYGYTCDVYGNEIDCHIGFYWGKDNSGEDLFWHSMMDGLSGDPMDKSQGCFNQISQLTAPSVYSYVLLVPIR